MLSELSQDPFFQNASAFGYAPNDLNVLLGLPQPEAVQGFSDPLTQSISTSSLLGSISDNPGLLESNDAIAQVTDTGLAGSDSASFSAFVGDGNYGNTTSTDHFVVTGYGSGFQLDPFEPTSGGVGSTGVYDLEIDTTTPDSVNSGTSISGNETLNGTLSPTDLNNPNRLGSYYDGYLLSGVSPGETVLVNLDASFDTYLQVVNAGTGEVLVFNDDSNNSLNSQLAFTVESGVDYIIRATSYGAGVIGNYTITTQTITLPDSYNLNYGYGLVDAAAAVADAVGETPFPNVPDLGGTSWGLDAINAPEVWAQGDTGQDVIVAVVDTGVDYNHPDLSNNIWVNSNEIAGDGVDNDGNGYVDDIRGWDFVDGDNSPMDLESHGTHVAGIIAAEDNGSGITGVAPNARIVPIRVLDADGYGNDTDIAAGIRYAVDNGANVINLSLGGDFSSDAESEAVQYAAEHGVVVVMAAGNERDLGASQPSFPGRLADRWGIAVGAVDSNKVVAYFSNPAGTTPLDYVVAPGVDILSTTPNNTYQSFSGTSMATPYVAGVAALILSANPNLTPAQVEQIVTETANPTGITV